MTMKRRIIPAISIVILFSLLFAIPALKQNSNENTYRDSLEVSQEREVEIQKIIDAGVESFTPTFSEFYWPGCAFYKYTPSAFEAGFCDGTNLAHIPFHIGAGLYENRGIAALYLELVTSKEDGTEICNLSTEIKQWQYLPPPTYVRLNTTIDVVSPANKSKYIAGCELGIRKSFNIGLKEEESRVKRVKKIIENTPAPEKSNQSPQNPASEGVDETSNAYITMFSVGKNFAKVSLATDTAQSQCASAMNDGIIFAQGIPRYLGVQTAMIQSLLKTKNGWQGCLDGFGQ
jgi:hypothetical protein